ncbi:hypothetical protein [Streptomyces sp. NPDC002962]|uniref:hypothetical protein n=1 Tax=Streptomyces sp. NPDC002962 TaxID=3364674 RepID=UPI0036CE76A4
MATEHDILLQFWQEQRDQARQSENQRAAMTNIVLVVAAAGIGFVVRQGLGDRSNLPVTAGLMLLGLYGALASAKYRERFAMHMHEAKLMRRRLDALYPALGLEADRQAARDGHQRQHRLLYQVRLHQLWTSLHLGIALMGAALAVASIV